MSCDATIKSSNNGGEKVSDLIIESLSSFSRTAVYSAEYSLSSEEILRLARFNADRLSGLGIKKNDFVLCAIDKHVSLPVAWLSVMFVGAVFVPVDIDWPVERLRYAAEITRSSFLLITRKMQRIELDGISSIEIDMIGHRSPPKAEELNTVETVAEALLYGFFTSGRTGTPKCALNHHAGVANRLRYMTKIFGRGNIVLQNSSHLFDSSIWQLLWPLASDGTVVIDPTHRVADVESTVRLIDQYGVTMTDFVPSIFRLLVQALKRGDAAKEHLRSLKHLLIGGEEIDAEVVRDFQQIMPEVDLVNTYGHTEASIGMVFHVIPKKISGRIALGLPIDNTYVRICGEDMSESSHGDIGEIVVGGICVGGGYLGRDDLTEKAFLANPFPDIPGGKVYRTGDMGRFNEEGLLEYHGRRDTQIKVRGVRLEMEEIEHAVNRAFNGEIIAYAVPLISVFGEQHVGLAYVAQDHFDGSTLRNRLAQLLPATHMPKAFLHIEEVPLTANGKADRRSIAQRFDSVIGTNVISDRELTLEDSLLGIFRRFFPGQEIGVDSSFFACGGDSIDSVNFVMELESELGLSMSVSRLYDLQTPRRLGSWLADPSNFLDAEVSDSLPQYLGPSFDRSALHVRAQQVLLTGSCGFVGAHVLSALINKTSTVISLIVRANSKREAIGRVYEMLFEMGLPLDLVGDRIHVFKGDLSQSKLGCSDKDWDFFSQNIDTIYHVGAEVNFLQSYQQLSKANVQSTIELLRLASKGSAKRFHYVSSAAAKAGDQIRLRLRERLTINDLTSEGLNGYAISKIASEKLLIEAADAGLNVSIYRLGEVMPAASVGVPNKKSMIYRFFQVCHKKRIAPANIGAINALLVSDAAERLLHEVSDPFLFSYRNKNLKMISLESESIYSVDRLFEEVETITGIGHRFYEYPQFLQEIERLDDTDARLLMSVLPPPGEVNNIFGDVVDSCREVSDLTYAEMAAGLMGIPLGKQLADEDRRHDIYA